MNTLTFNQTTNTLPKSRIKADSTKRKMEMIVRSKSLSPLDKEKFGKEVEALRAETMSKVGETDARHIRKTYAIYRYSEVAGRAILHFSFEPITFSIGTALLAFSKIVNNMELGHNVMHGQYDWMNDPKFDSRKFEWDIVSDSKQWKFYHNYIHHTFTNVIGKDHDFGYKFTRLTTEQKWNWTHFFQPITNLFLAFHFQWGVGAHGYKVEYLEKPKKQRTKRSLGEYRDVFLKKIQRQVFKDYVFYPLLGGLMAPKILLGNFIANGIRNLWTYAIIFCGHFTEEAETFSPKEIESETKAEWYLRQLKGSSNLSGSKFFYFLSGHLSHQIEHHMFPDMPANRYEEVAPKLQEICEKYGQNYNNGGFFKQFGSVWKKIFIYALP